MNQIDILAEYYPLDDLLTQNDIDPVKVVTFLVDEGLIDLEDYFYLEEMYDDDDDTAKIEGRNGRRPGY